MLRTFLNWRTYVLLTLTGVAFFLLAADLLDSWPNFAGFILTLLSKIVGCGVFLATYKLMLYWERRNLIPEITNISKR